MRTSFLTVAIFLLSRQVRAEKNCLIIWDPNGLGEGTPWVDDIRSTIETRSGKGCDRFYFLPKLDPSVGTDRKSLLDFFSFAHFRKTPSTASELTPRQVSEAIAQFKADHISLNETFVWTHGVPNHSVGVTPEVITEDNLNYFQTSPTLNWARIHEQFGEDKFGIWPKDDKDFPNPCLSISKTVSDLHKQFPVERSTAKALNQSAAMLDAKIKTSSAEWAKQKLAYATPALCGLFHKRKELQKQLRSLSLPGSSGTPAQKLAECDTYGKFLAARVRESSCYQTFFDAQTTWQGLDFSAAQAGGAAFFGSCSLANPRPEYGVELTDFADGRFCPAAQKSYVAGIGQLHAEQNQFFVKNLCRNAPAGFQFNLAQQDVAIGNTSPVQDKPTISQDEDPVGVASDLCAALDVEEANKIPNAQKLQMLMLEDNPFAKLGNVESCRRMTEWQKTKLRARIADLHFLIYLGFESSAFLATRHLLTADSGDEGALYKKIAGVYKALRAHYQNLKLDRPEEQHQALALLGYLWQQSHRGVGVFRCYACHADGANEVPCNRKTSGAQGGLQNRFQNLFDFVNPDLFPADLQKPEDLFQSKFTERLNSLAQKGDLSFLPECGADPAPDCTFGKCRPPKH